MAIDIDQSHYNTGTATVEADGLTVTGQGTAWLGSVRRGDLYGTHRGSGVRIEAVNSNTSLTLAYSVPDLDQAAAPYEIQRTPFDVGYLRAIEEIIRLMGQGALPELAAVDGTGGDRLIKMTGPKTAEAFEARRLVNIAALTSAGVIELAPNGDATVVPKSELINGIAVNRRVNTLAERAAYDAEPEQFSVYVANVGDGRAAAFFRQGPAGGWSDPAYGTGPAITLDVTDVDEVPFGAPPDVTLAPRAGGYDVSFVLPRGMIIEPGTTTTLASDQPAAVSFVPVTGGYRVDFSIPRGPTGDIDGVTSFWVTRLGNDSDVEAARTGLGIPAKADQPTAEGGTNDQDFMTSLQVKNSILKNVPPIIPQLQAYWMPSNLELAEISTTTLSIGMDEGNGIFDGFNSLTWVDVANAVNLDTSEAGQLKPTTSLTATVLDVLASMNENSTAWVNYNVRQFYRANILGNSGTQVRLTLTGATSGSGLVITGMTFGRRLVGGDPYDFAAAPVAVTVGGAASFTVAVGATVVTDWIAFAFDETLDHVIAFHSSSGDMRRKGTVSPDSILYAKAGATEIAVQNVSAYSENTATSLGLVSRIESRTVGGAMPLAVESKDVLLPEGPDWGRVVAFVSLNGAAVDADILFKLARDGDDFATVDMVQKYTRGDGSVMLDSGVVDLSGIDLGTTARWRIETANNKLPSILAVGCVFGVNE